MRRRRATRRSALPPIAAVLLAGLPVLDGCADPRPHVILVVVDTLRADHVGTYGYGREATPSLDRRAREGVLFENALAPSSWTLPSFGSLFTGHIPSRHAAGLSPSLPKDPFTKLDPSLPTLAGLLAERGYATAGVANNAWLGPGFDLSRGFEHWDYKPSSDRVGRRADEVVDRSLSWIDGRPAGRPFLLLVHMFDPHMSYDAPEPARGSFTAAQPGEWSLPVSGVPRLRERAGELSADERAFITAAYDEEIAFVDAQLERLVDGLEGRGLLERSIVILTSDHGEELFDHGGFEHGHSMYQELLRVPLVVWSPEARPGRRDAPVSLVDLLPTVLDAVGLAPPPGLAGRSLWPTLAGSGHRAEPRALISEGTLWGHETKAIVRWPMKLVVEFPDLELQLYDLTADAQERRELTGTEPATAARMLEELRATVLAAADRRSPGERATVDDDVMDKLRSLGYVD